MATNDFTLEVTLKQHTPIIHFQHEQEGATLRATEVKPKLDKFLIEKKGGWGNIPSLWKMAAPKGKDGEKVQALQYKLILIGNAISVRDIEIDVWKERKGKYEKESHPCFFANIKEAHPKRFSESEGINLKIISMNLDLLSFIKDHIAEFFVAHNFGTRQSKGFGCFTAQGASFPKSCFSFFVPSKDLRVVFGTIDLFYKTLRSGINGAALPDGGTGFVRGFYMKPLIWQYAQSKDINWEKKQIKEEYFRDYLFKQQYRDDDPNKDEQYRKNIKRNDFEPTPLHWPQKEFRLVRDWLGLSTEQAWKGYPGAKGQASITKVQCDQKGKEFSAKDGIARMKSPLLFKPIEEESGYRVYFFPDKNEKAQEKFREAYFKVKNNGSGNLKIKVWKEFDLNDFLDFSFRPGVMEDSIPKHWQNDNQGKKIYQEIIRIYNDIRKRS